MGNRDTYDFGSLGGAASGSSGSSGSSSQYVNAVLQSNPNYMWRLRDAAPSGWNSSGGIGPYYANEISGGPSAYANGNSVVNGVPTVKFKGDSPGPHFHDAGDVALCGDPVNGSPCPYQYAAVSAAGFVGDVTIEGWFKLNAAAVQLYNPALDTGTRIIGWDWIFDIDGTGRQQDAGGGSSASLFTPPAGIWFYLVIVFHNISTNGGYSIYYNTGLVGSIGAGTPTQNPNKSSFIYWAAQSNVGQIAAADIALYWRALSVAEITNHYQAS